MTGPNGRRVVIGVGNPDRGDDGAGRAVARRLRQAVPGGIEVLEESGEVSALLACLEGSETAYLVDACVSSSRPGTVRRFDASARPLPPNAFATSTHGLGLADAVELARALGRLPRRCIVYAIEAVDFETGAGLSPEVSAAVHETALRIDAELRDRHVPTDDPPADRNSELPRLPGVDGLAT